MGLDMYFYAKTKNKVNVENLEDDNYRSFCPWDGEGKVDETNYPEDLKELGDYIYKTNFKSSFIDKDEASYYYQIGYFRKFNALHAYMVDTLANGVDECQEIEITKDDLLTLLDKLNKINNDRVEAANVLPTQDGFFFGSTNYDEYYFSDVKDAIEMCELFLKYFNFDKYDLIYQASW